MPGWNGAAAGDGHTEAVRVEYNPKEASPAIGGTSSSEDAKTWRLMGLHSQL